MEILLRVCEEAEALFRQIEKEDGNGFSLEKAPIFNEALTIGFSKILEDIRREKCGAYDLDLRKVTQQEQDEIYQYAMKRSKEIVNGESPEEEEEEAK